MPEERPPARLDESGDISYDYDPESEIPVLPDGRYGATIERAEVKIKEGGVIPFLALVCRADPQGSQTRGTPLFENISFKAHWRLSALSNSIYGKGQKGQGRLNALDLINRRILVEVGHETNNRGRLVNNIQRFIAAGEDEYQEAPALSEAVAPGEGDVPDWGWDEALESGKETPAKPTPPAARVQSPAAHTVRKPPAPAVRPGPPVRPSAPATRPKPPARPQTKTRR